MNARITNNVAIAPAAADNLDGELEAMMRGLAGLLKNKPNNGRVEVVRGDTAHVVVPHGMPLLDAAEWLRRSAEREETFFSVDHRINCFPYDGAVQLHAVVEEMFGFVLSQGFETFFGRINPNLVTVRTGHRPQDVTQIPWGRFSLIWMDEDEYLSLNSHVSGSPRMVQLVIGGEIKLKHKHIVAEIARRTEERLKTHSIYQGRALKVANLGWMDSGSRIHEPTFWDVGDREPALILDPEVQLSLQANLFNRIERTDLVRRIGAPVGTSLLLTGPYGTGKTLAAALTAWKAVHNGWTFLYVENADDLANALVLSNMYTNALSGKGVVVFCEDVERTATKERDDDTNRLLNIVDGVQKGNATDIILVMTTNHVDAIAAAFMRAERVSTIITLGNPTGQTITRFIRLYAETGTGNARVTIAQDVNWDEVIAAMEGFSPAFIRQSVARAQLAQLASATVAGDGSVEIVLDTASLVGSALSFKDHARMAMLEALPATSAADEMVEALARALTQSDSVQDLVGEFCDDIVGRLE